MMRVTLLPTATAAWVALTIRLADSFSHRMPSRLAIGHLAPKQPSSCLSVSSNTKPEIFSGSPSTPGFELGEFDKLSSWALTTTSNRPAVAEYKPDVGWLWTQWEGTIRQMTWRSVVITITWAALVNFYAYYHYTNDVVGSSEGIVWYSSAIRHSDDAFFEFLDSVGVFWEYNLTLVIFTLAFFLNTAYDHWKRVYFSARAIQGRINDLCMLVTAGAARTNEYGEIDGVTGYQSTVTGYQSTDSERHYGKKAVNSKKLVLDTARFLRLSHAFFWAATPTKSDGLATADINVENLPEDFDPTKLGPKLMSKEGLEILIGYGQLTTCEMDAILSTGLSPSQYPYVMLEWAMLRCMGGLRMGELVGGQGLEENLLRQFTQLRAEYFNIGDYAAGRMSMAYIIAVEIIVDVFLFFCPLALYTKMGAFSLVSTGLITLSFKGLLELSKSFLDTFGIEGYKAHNIRVDVLVSEVNFGSSQRWVKAGEALPSVTEGGMSKEQLTRLADLQDLIASVPDSDDASSPVNRDDEPHSAEREDDVDE